jgi:hypothetical protein
VLTSNKEIRKKEKKNIENLNLPVLLAVSMIQFPANSESSLSVADTEERL